MATVAQIYARLAAENDSKLRRTSLSDTGLFEPLTEKDYEVADQPTAAPTRKVTVGALAGALTVLAVYLLGLGGVELPAEGAAALTTLVSFVLSYLVPSAYQDV